jgi:hypothetical protein
LLVTPGLGLSCHHCIHSNRCSLHSHVRNMQEGNSIAQWSTVILEIMRCALNSRLFQDLGLLVSVGILLWQLKQINTQSNYTEKPKTHSNTTKLDSKITPTCQPNIPSGK